jgi:2-oxo-4-hydroxy-4-carboxy-5-ureidoimidazoline decarboxylase
VTLGDLNACERDAFTEAVGWVFEHSPWVAERAWSRRPFASVDALHAAMTSVVAASDRDEQLALLRAHPDLGTRARPREGLSEASAAEQAGVGLDRLAPDAFERLHRLNDTYRRRFGFPFLFAVKGCTAAQVLDALAARVSAPAVDEFAEAMRQVARIARFRLEALLVE